MTASARARRHSLPETSRYELLLKIASGGMATVYVGRSRTGISRLFAIKRAHPHLADDPAFRSMFVAEARLASRIHHPNVVAVQDVEELDDELLLVMDYVEGIALSEWIPDADAMDARGRARIGIRVILDACAGLEAAHELTDEAGRPLEVVHRDVSPQNLLVGVDGIARVTDFGIAKSRVQTGVTATGGLKGKLAYMSAEYIETGRLDRRADVFALGVVTWEVLTASRLFRSTSEAHLMNLVLACEVPPPSSVSPVLAPLDAVVLRATARDPAARWQSVREFADALERAAQSAGLLGTHADVARAVQESAAERLAERRAKIRGDVAPPAEDDDDSLAIAEPSRTHTLDGPGTATRVMPLSHPPEATPPRKGSSLLGPAIALAALLATVGTWMLVRDRPHAPVTATPAAPEVAPVPLPPPAEASVAVMASSEPLAAPTDAGTPPRTTRTPAPSAHARRPGAPASPAEDPPLPSRAPPNPYKTPRP